MFTIFVVGGGGCDLWDARIATRAISVFRSTCLLFMAGQTLLDPLVEMGCGSRRTTIGPKKRRSCFVIHIFIN